MFDLTSKMKSFDTGEEVEIMLIKSGDKEITDTSGAKLLTGFSISNISKLARTNKIASMKQGKGRLIDIASLRTYYTSERRQPSATSRKLETYEAFVQFLPKKKQAELALLLTAIDSQVKSDSK